MSLCLCSGSNLLVYPLGVFLVNIDIGKTIERHHLLTSIDKPSYMAKLYNFEGVEQVGFEYCAGNLGLLLELDGLSWRVKTGDEFFDYLQHVLAPGLPAEAGDQSWHCAFW